MKKWFCAMVFGISVLTIQGVMGAKLDDVKAFVEKGITYYKAHGREAALKEFGNTKGQFVKGDLYFFVIDDKGNVLAHGGNPKLVGQNMYDLQDPNGKLFIQEFIKTSAHGGWVDYVWANPVTKKLQFKTSFVKRVDNVIIGCGIYK